MDDKDTGSELNIGRNVGAGSAVGSGQVSAGNIAEQVTADYVAGGNIIFGQVPLSERQERLQKLGQRLGRYLGRLEKMVQSPDAVVRSAHPYLGLTPYQIESHRQFGGREKLIQEIEQRIASKEGLDTRLLVLYGAPGVGKTSLVQAGLMPQLVRGGHLPFYVHIWQHPPTDAFYRLFLEEWGPELSLLQVLSWMALIMNRRLYLIFDQFETFFDRYFNDRQRANYIAQLGECLQVSDLDVVFVLVVRTEKYASFNAFKPYIPTIFSNELEVPLLNREDALTAISRPLIGLSDQEVFSPDLLKAILDDLDDQGIDPIQLQIICDTLWGRRVEGPIDIIAYQKVGGRKGILSQYLQSLLDRHVKSPYRPLSRSILISLMSSDGRLTTKTRQQLAQSLGEAPEMDAVLTDLENLGLIYAETQVPDTMIYTLSHRYLEKVIELDADAINRKRVEELLETGLREFQLRQSPLSEHNYQFIKQYVDKGTVIIIPEAKAWWQRSRRDSAMRHLIFRLLAVILLAPLTGITAVGYVFGDWLVNPAPPPDPVQGLIYATIGLGAAVAAAVINGLGVIAISLLEYRFIHWTRWKQLGLFLSILLLPWICVGIVAVLLQPTGAIIHSSTRQSLVWGLVCGLFYGALLYLNWLGTWQSWRRQLLRSLIIGPVGGLLLAAVLLITDSLLGTALDPTQQRQVWVAGPAYMITLLTTFTLGWEAGRRLLLGSPSSSRL